MLGFLLGLALGAFVGYVIHGVTCAKCAGWLP